MTDREEPVLVDEWQLVPETLQVINTEVDQRPDRGRFLVTGAVTGPETIRFDDGTVAAPISALWS